jgi:PKD repeat protein
VRKPQWIDSIGAAFWIFTALLGLVGASWATGSSAVKIEHLEGGYSVHLPVNLSISYSPVADFSLYRVTDPAGKQLLLIYLGSAPDTRFKPSANAVSSSTPIGGYAATSVRWTDKGETFNGTTLLQLTGDRWPRFAHMIFRDLSKSDSELAESIVWSFSGDQAQK